jgi:hypothetical protein
MESLPLFILSRHYRTHVLGQLGPQLQQIGQPDGDAGDPYNGYDRFGRTVDIRRSTPIE